MKNKNYIEPRNEWMSAFGSGMVPFKIMVMQIVIFATVYLGGSWLIFNFHLFGY